MKFDVIVGNPPYDGIYKGLGSPWPKISLKSIELLSTNGYIAFITPLSWMSPSSDLLNKFKENSLLYVDITIGHYFNVGSTFSAWVLKRDNKTDTETYFINNDGDMKIKLSKFSFLPNIQNKAVFSILSKLLEDTIKFNVQVSSELHTQQKPFSKTQTTEYNFAGRHTNTEILFFKTKSSNFDTPKITFSVTGNFEPRFDNGDLGTCQNTMWIECNSDNAEYILDYLKNSKVMKFIFKVCKWSGANNRNILRLLPSIPKFDENITDAEVYKYFKLTKEEIDYIEKTVK